MNNGQENELTLDKRQRAMLREMGVRVWQPMVRPAAEPVADVAAPVGFAIHAAEAATPAAAVTTPPAAVSVRPAIPAVQAPAAEPGPARSLSAPAVAPTQAPGLQPLPAGIERMNWAELQAAVAGCRACSLCESRRNTVFGVGPTTPDESVAPVVDWLIVGEAPGESEDRAGEPFVGPAGKLLDNMLSAIRLQRGSTDAPRAGLSSRVFIANALKCRPPANRNPEPAEIAQCEPYLKRQVELLKPKVIIAMGKFAAQSLLDASVPELQKTPLGRLRGRAYYYQGVPVVVTYHPAYLLRSLPEKAKAWEDLCLAMDVFAGAS